jgi:predicted DNA-binding transcriptional regulator YafY
MRRADRLFQIVALLQSRRMITAQRLADELSVSVRTIYRDIADLADSGVPVEGEAGVGYRLSPGYTLPPLTFDREEIEALVMGARMAESHADTALGEAARRALVKIEAVLPAPMRKALLSTALFAPTQLRRPAAVERLEPLRAAIGARNKVSLDYVRKDDEVSARVVRPVGLYFWGSSWSLAAWCELRQDWRSFRVDRMSSMRVLDEIFSEDITLEAYVRHIEAEAFHYVSNYGGNPGGRKLD